MYMDAPLEWIGYDNPEYMTCALPKLRGGWRILKALKCRRVGGGGGGGEGGGGLKNGEEGEYV